MIILNKSDIEPVLITISVYNKETNELIGGLLKEDLTLGSKRKLQKIHKEVYKLYLELIKDVKQIKEVCKDDEEKVKKELEELLKEQVKVDVEPLQFSFLENVSTKANYNFDIIEKFTI